MPIHIILLYVASSSDHLKNGSNCLRCLKVRSTVNEIAVKETDVFPYKEEHHAQEQNCKDKGQIKS